MADHKRPVIWSSDALSDFAEIWSCFSTVAGPHTANKIVREIAESCRVLEDHPLAGELATRYGRICDRSLSAHM
jgi:plasmid stabilization system protein ParE